MKRRVLSLLVALCLIIGLLPPVVHQHAHAASAEATVTVMSGTDYAITLTAVQGGAGSYTKNKSVKLTDGAGSEFDGWVQETCTATDAWNVAFEWPADDAAPTIKLKGAKLDAYNNPVDPDATNATIKSAFVTDAIGFYCTTSYSGKTMNVLIQEDSWIECESGILNGYKGSSQYWKVLNISSVGAAKLYGIGLSKCVTTRGTLNLTNANLDITSMSTSTSTTAKAAVPFRSYQAPLTITNSNVNVTASAYVCILADASGASLTIEDSNININYRGDAKAGQADTLGAINSSGSLTVTGGTLTADSRQMALRAGSNLILNSGEYNIKTSYYGIGAKTAVQINGGSYIIDSTDDAFLVAPTFAEGLAYTAEDKDGNPITDIADIKSANYVKITTGTETPDPEEPTCGHSNVTAFEAKKSTCKELGNKAYVYCNDCQKYFAEQTCETEIEEGSWILTKYADCVPEVDDGDDTTAVHCTVCGKVLEGPIEPPVWPEDVTFATAEQMTNVVLEKKASAGGSITAHPGGKITFKLYITNNNSEVINVHVADLLPKNTKLISGCDYTSGRALYWVVKDIEPGETRVITYNVKPNYTIKEVRASEEDIVLKNTDATVMDVTVPAPAKDIWVLETFNATDIRRIEMAIDAMVTANLTAKNSSNQTMCEIPLLNMIYYVGFSAGPGLGTIDAGEIFTLIFEKSGEVGSGGASGGVEDVVDKGQDLLDRVPPHLYGGTAVPTEKDGQFRGERATEVTIKDLISGDLLFVKQNGETKLYIVDGAHLVYLGKTEIIRKIDPATVLPTLPAYEQFVVVRPSINYNITFSLQDGEYFNDADREGYTDVEKALIATAEAYLLRGDRTQYTDDMTGKSANRAQNSTKQPEDYTVDQYGYTNCAYFTYDVHWATLDYKAQGKQVDGTTKPLSTTTYNASYAKNYWDAETGTSSSKGVIFYCEPSKIVPALDEAGKEALKAQIISLMRPGDIINIRRATGSGHAMLYVGNGMIIHSSGSNYKTDNSSGKTDTHEASIRFRMVEDLFDPEIYNATSCVYNLDSFSLIRLQNLTSKGISENTANRINNMQGVIAEKVSSTAMGKTVNCGDEITYTFYVFNTNAEDKEINISDVVSEYADFVSATNGGSCTDGNVSWNIVVPADTRVSVSYTVKVKEGVAAYTAIDGTKATINGVSHKCYNTYVANTLNAQQQQTIIEAVNTVKCMDTTDMNAVDIINLIYNTAFGVDNIFGNGVTTELELIGNIQDAEGMDNVGVFNDTGYYTAAGYVSLMDSNTSPAAMMVAPGMFGGQYVYNSSRPNEAFTRYQDMAGKVLRSRYYWEKDLVVGDIFFMGGSSTLYVYIYVGNDTFVNMNNADVFGTSSVIERLQYASAGTWRYHAVLRPSVVLEEELSIPVCEHDWADADCDTPKTCSKCQATEGEALGHSYDNALDTECNNGCGTTREIDTFTVENNKVVISTGATIKEIVTLSVFYGVDGTVADLNNWDAVVAVSEGYKTYEAAATENVVLFDGGTYILRLRYLDENGTIQLVSIQKTVAGLKAPEMTVENGKVIIDRGSQTNEILTLTVFYGVSGTASDLNDWGAVSAISAGYRTYEGAAIEKVALTENGTYILRLRYTDASGATQTISIQKDVTGFEKPEITVEKGKVVINQGSQANELLTLSVFYGVNGTASDLNDWGAVSAISAGYRTYEGAAIKKVALTENGTYILRLRYTDASEVTQTLSIRVIVTGFDKPEITVEGDKIKVTKPENVELLTLSVFYGVEETVADLNNWDRLIEASAGYKTYIAEAINDATLPANGGYILRLRYTDAQGNTQVLSEQIDG